MTNSVRAFSLMGDSFPADQRIEEEIAQRWPVDLVRYSALAATYPSGAGTLDIPTRLDALRAAVARVNVEPVFALGRSSGALVATRMAAEWPTGLAGIVALGYPFRHPSRGDEPERYLHLADLTTPTLIIQGSRDRYGAGEAIKNIRLSTAVRYVEIAADHELRCSAATWDQIAELIVKFSLDVVGAGATQSEGSMAR